MGTSTFRYGLTHIAATLALLVVTALPAAAYSSAPGSCSAELFYPVHGAAHTGDGNYFLSSTSSTYTPGQSLAIFLGGTQPFRGLLLYVHDSAGTHRGTFQPPAGYQGMGACGGDPLATLGHASSVTKSPGTFFPWIAPVSGDPLTVVAVVMVDVSSYYVLPPITILPATNDAGPGPAEALAVGSLHVFPNPFAEAVAIHYESASDGPVSIRVYDLGGRWIRSLNEGPVAAGRHALEWDGRDGQGVAVGPGVYFVHVIAGGRSEVQKVVRLD